MLSFKLLLFLCFSWNAAFAADCVWDKDSDYPSDDEPVIMDLATWRTVVPKMEGGNRITRVAEGTVLVIGCPETTISALGVEVAEAVCVGDQVLSVDGQQLTLSELGCSSTPEEAIERDLGSCGVGGELSSIGYNLPGYPFYNLIFVCFDPVYETTLYTNHVVRGESTEARDTGGSRPSFKSDTGFFTVSANTCYLQDSQEALMADILGDSSVIDTSTDLYFSRGHMSPDADFVTQQEQDATYYYINAVPQWQAFNAGNWLDLENSVRDLAISRVTDIQVWSGGWGVLQLPDTSSNMVDIFLGLTEGEEVIPAPYITWKVVYDPLTNEGAAVVGVNNPYLTATPTPVCGSESFCSQLSWLDADVSFYEDGATYCCTVQELNSAVPSAPDLGDASLLN